MAKGYPEPKRIKKLNHPEKYVGDSLNIITRSSWERKFIHWCDNNPSVLRWNSEETVIQYWSRADQKARRYFVDFTVKMVDTEGKTRMLLVEIKPDAQTVPPVKGRKRAATYLKEKYDFMVNQDKWEAASAFAKQHGAEFVVMTEYDLGLAKRKVSKQ